jgi:hypothetical protein
VLSDCGFLNLILGWLNYFVVVATFHELVVVAVWFVLLEIDGKTIARAAMRIVLVGIAKWELALAEDP